MKWLITLLNDTPFGGEPSDKSRSRLCRKYHTAVPAKINSSRSHASTRAVYRLIGIRQTFSERRGVLSIYMVSPYQFVYIHTDKHNLLINRTGPIGCIAATRLALSFYLSNPNFAEVLKPALSIRKLPEPKIEFDFHCKCKWLAEHCSVSHVHTVSIDTSHDS